LVIDDNT
jgi:hypothetical protein